ncbi:MAG: MBL fold metallo-hydrolase [Helicobacteraceae bacterium]|jgi:glyoxylase-like metal-dependent hydrolase (beta-lactamase superfamily II)|nr:MBL fold metallo-hydrolase [Helicobacteraceae bacterium]
MKKLILGLLAISFAFGAEGVFRYQVGDLEAIAIKDRDTNMGKEILLDPDAPIVKEVLADNQNPSSINAFVIRSSAPQTRFPTILIDTGTGGDIFANLKEANIALDSIEIILIAHMHGDHIGGLIQNGKATFKNAAVFLPKNDLGYWLGSGDDNKKAAIALQEVYGDRLATFEWDKEIAGAIKTIRAEGHTPGHSAFLIESKGQKLFIVGDLIHSIKVQTADPTQSVVYDVDPVLAASTRKKLLNYAANANLQIAGMHIPFPGIGKVVKEKDGFRFTPIERP